MEPVEESENRGKIDSKLLNLQELKVRSGIHVCPPKYTRDLSKNLEQSYLYIFPGIAHSPIDFGLCGIMMMKEFIDNPTKAPDSSCLQEFQGGFVLPE